LFKGCTALDEVIIEPTRIHHPAR